MTIWSHACHLPALLLLPSVLLAPLHQTIVSITQPAGGSSGQSLQCYAGLGAGSGAAAEAHGPALHRLEREAIAAATQISYPQSELMMLIHEHLQAKGLHAAASALAQEAGLAGGGLGESKPPLQRDLMPAMDVEAGSRQGIDTSSAGRGDAGPLLLGGLTPTLAGICTPARQSHCSAQHRHSCHRLP